MDSIPWVEVVSSWVQAMYWDSGTLFLRFHKDGIPTVTCQYDDVSLDMWLDLLGATSKGQWVHAHLIPWDYKIVS